MAIILTSIHGIKLGLDVNGNLVIDGPGIIVNNGSSPILLGGANAQVAAGSTLTLTNAVHSGKTIKLDTLTGSVVTLPAATGSGARFRFRVSVLATSNSHKIQVANGTDVMQGFIFSVDDTADGAVGFFAAATSDTISLNRTTTGSVSLGEFIEIEDIAAGFFHVRGYISNSGTPATPFSAAVS